MTEKLPTISAEDALKQLQNTASTQPTVSTAQTEDVPRISAQEALRQLGQNVPVVTAEEVENSIVRPTGEEDLSWWENHTYAWDSTLSPSRELSEWATRNNFLGMGNLGAVTLGWDGEQWRTETTITGKLGAFVTTPEERGFPEGYEDMTPEQRRVAMNEIYQKELAEKYPEVTAQGGAKGAGAITGTLSSLIADPLTAIPITGTGVRAFATGGALAGTYTAAETERKTGEIDPIRVAGATVLGGAGAVVINKGLKTLGQKIDQRAIDKAKVTVNKTVDTANDVIAKLIASEKYTADNVVDVVATKMKLTPYELNMMAKSVGRQVNIPDVQTAKVIDQMGMLPKDPLAVSTLSKLTDKTSNVFNRVVQPLSAYVKDRSPELDGSIKKYDFDLHRRANEYEIRLKPFEQTLNSLDDKTLTQVRLDLSNENFDAVRTTLQNAGKDVDSFDQYQVIMKEIATDLKNSGVTADIENYFPRLVTDLKSLRETMGVTNKSFIDKVKDKRLADLNKNRKNKKPKLSQAEEDAVMNDILSGKIRIQDVSGAKSIKQKRAIQQVTEDMLPFYASPTESIKSYVRQASATIEQAKLFGKNKVLNEAGDGFDSEASIGMVLNKLKNEGKITSATEAELADVMQVYFGNGQKSPSKLISELKALGYIQTLGSYQSTLTQIKDLGMSAYAQGLTPTIRAMIPGMSGKGAKVTARQQGLDTIIANEYSDAAKMTRALDKILTATGFRALDRFGKSTTMTAAINKWAGKVKSQKGISELKQKYGPAFANDFDQLVVDLQTKKQTARTDLLAWHELTRTQPISAYEMPVSFLNNPDFRILYSLKSFMLKQLQLVRDDIFRTAKTRPVEAATNAMRYAVLLNLAGIPVDVTKDLLLNRPINDDRIKEYAQANLLSFAGVNQYMVDRYLAQGDMSGYFGALITPSITGLLNDVVKDVTGALKEEDAFALDDKQPSLKTLGNAPFIGPYIENYFGGGREKAIKRIEQKEARDQFSLD